MKSAFRRLLARDESGSMSVELVLLTPAIVLIILFLVAAGRISLASNAAEAAAISAAREASLSRTTSVAQERANEAAQVSMAQSGYQCSKLTVVIDDSGLDVPLGKTGTVSGTITCTLNLTDIALPGLPGTWTVTKSAISPVDAFRERE